MSEFQTVIRVKKTRKEHRCFICCRKIPKGFSAIHYKGKADDFYDDYLCNTCQKLVEEFPDSVQDWWEGCFDSQTFFDSCSDNNVATPLQLLNELRRKR